VLSVTIAAVSSPGSSSSNPAPAVGGNQPSHIYPFLTSISGVKHSKHKLFALKRPQKERQGVQAGGSKTTPLLSPRLPTFWPETCHRSPAEGFSLGTGWCHAPPKVEFILVLGNMEGEGGTDARQTLQEVYLGQNPPLPRMYNFRYNRCMCCREEQGAAIATSPFALTQARVSTRAQYSSRLRPLPGAAPACRASP